METTEFKKIELSAEDKQLIADATGYSIYMIRQMCWGKRKMQKIVLNKIEELQRIKENFANND